MSFFDYLENEILEVVTGKSSYTTPVVYIGLSSTDPTDAGASVTEPTTGSYARVTTSAADWAVAAAGTTSNIQAISFAQASGDWLAGANLISVVAFDSLTTGNPLWYGNLTVDKPVLSGDTASFPIGDITITLD